jgi:hypothetical protein
VNDRIVLSEAVYLRTREARDLEDNLRLRALEWALYFAVDGKHTAAELGRQIRVEIADRDEALARLMSLGIIKERELNAWEYVHALAASGDREEKTLQEFLLGAAKPAGTTGTAGVVPEVSRSPQQTDRESSTVPHLVQFEPTGSPRSRLRDAADIAAPSASTALRRIASQPAFGFKPLPSPEDDTKENRPMSVSRRLSLRAFMNLIERHAGSREAGQLDTYRVFVRIDTPLLRRNGIETLRFADDRLVSDPELEKALVRSLKKTLGLDCPESVWVEVV